MVSESYLILENGAVFKGQAFGYDAETVGELVFSTGMAGYLETLTDPCYSGQIVLQTFPLAGNYGVIPADFESGAVSVKAYIVREWCQEPSNFRSEGELDTFLRDNKVPGLCGIDTRALTRIIRENGVMNAKISKSPELSDKGWSELRSYKVTRAAAVSTDGIGTVKTHDAKFTAALWNFGCTKSFIGEAAKRVGGVTVFSPDATAEDIFAVNPDGIILSEGPGDPAENTAIIEEIKKLCGVKIPILAVGLGHQMLALATGAKTIKLPFGHRGANQPVRAVRTGQVFVTTQNHGYAVEPESLPDTAEMTFANCNDDTCEGIFYRDIPALSIEFRPDDPFAFNSFIALMEGSDSHAAK